MIRAVVLQLKDLRGGAVYQLLPPYYPAYFVIGHLEAAKGRWKPLTLDILEQGVDVPKDPTQQIPLKKDY